MLMDAKWTIKTTGGSENFTFSAATAQSSDAINLRGQGFADGGGKLYLHANRSGTYTKNAMTALAISLEHSDTEGSGYVMAEEKVLPVAAIDASTELVKILLPPGLKQYIRVTITPTGAPTAITVNARITTS